MDDASPHQRWTPRTTPADGGEQGRAARIRATAATAATRVHEQAVKAAMAGLHGQLKDRPPDIPLFPSSPSRTANNSTSPQQESATT
ncbi:hypothetical protein OH809_43460 [Streptomyces sp. NBC_00873]|nr:hypothetical protein OH809_00250 [Streptomyces sp. NBC_00873]WSY96880.1 hypothetical protein OH809_43460 [Streptomyces sp. NBC_00873]